MRHDNLLSFIAADTVIKNWLSYHYLISEYHARGTLRDFLEKSVLELPEALLLISTLVSGVEYLHRPVSQQGRTAEPLIKPAIAHCNLTSDNIYVDKSGTYLKLTFVPWAYSFGRFFDRGKSANFP